MIQPPEIRHRVLEASADIEVIEIGVPAEHVTTIDHEMELPNGPARPERRFQGQRFVHHRASEAEWAPARSAGYSSRDTGIAAGTDGVASVHVVRRGEGDPGWSVHGADILFTFVLEGSLKLEGAGQESARLSAGDAFVVPPGMKVRLAEPSDDVELLEVALPGRFETPRRLTETARPRGPRSGTRSAGRPRLRAGSGRSGQRAIPAGRPGAADRRSPPVRPRQAR